MINFMKEYGELFRTYRFKHFNRARKQRFSSVQKFLYIYNYFFSTTFIDLFYLIKFFKTRQQRVLHYLILNFTQNKLFVNIQNYAKKNYLFLSAGLFIKFFEKKKSFKKNKAIKLLMAKYIRKLFLISKIKNTILIIKKTPVYLLEMLKLINSPIAHKFVNPFDKIIIEELEESPL